MGLLRWFKRLWASITQTHQHVHRYEQAGSSGSPALAFMKLAVQQAEVGQVDQALQNFQQALLIESEKADIYANLGIVLAKAGYLEEAETKFKKASELEPERAIYYVLWGACLIDLGQKNEATEKYEMAIALKPQHVEPWLNWSIALSRAGETEEAIEKLQRALQLNPTQPQAFYLWGTLLAEQADYKKALSKLETCLKYEANHSEALFLSAVVRHKLGQHEAAIAILNTFQEKTPDKPEVLHVLGDCKLDLGAYEEAELYLQQAYCINPDSADIQLSQARLLEALGKGQEACDLYASLQEHPAPPKGLTLRWARALIQMDRLAEALTLCQAEDPTLLDDEDAVAYFNTRLTIEYRLGEFTVLVHTLKQAQARFPQQGTFHFTKGLLHAQKGYFTEALADFKRANDLDSTLEASPLNYGIMLLQNYEWAEALRYFRVLYRHSPTDPSTVTCYALTQIAKGQLHEARTKLEMLCEQDPIPLPALSALLYATLLDQPHHIKSLLERFTPLSGLQANIPHWSFVEAITLYELSQQEETLDVQALQDATPLWEALQARFPDLKGHPLEAWRKVTPWFLWLIDL
jgi:tetratricopeptide (TPR) repeat protein